VVPVVGKHPGRAGRTDRYSKGPPWRTSISGDNSKWNDRANQEAQSKLALPDTTIAPVCCVPLRWLGNQLLLSDTVEVEPEVSRTWHAQTTSVQGGGIGPKGNGGRPQQTHKTDGAIGQRVCYASRQHGPLRPHQQGGQNKTVAPSARIIQAADVSARLGPCTGIKPEPHRSGRREKDGRITGVAELILVYAGPRIRARKR